MGTFLLTSLPNPYQHPESSYLGESMWVPCDCSERELAHLGSHNKYLSSHGPHFCIFSAEILTFFALENVAGLIFLLGYQTTRGNGGTPGTCTMLWQRKELLNKTNQMAEHQGQEDPMLLAGTAKPLP